MQACVKIEDCKQKDIDTSWSYAGMEPNCQPRAGKLDLQHSLTIYPVCWQTE